MTKTPAEVIAATLGRRELSTVNHALSVAAERFDEHALGLACLYAFDPGAAFGAVNASRLAVQFQTQAREARAVLAKLGGLTMAQVHRFRDKVAVWVGKGETVYLSPANARKLARAIYRAAKSCETEPFGQSAGLTVIIEEA